MSKNKSLATPNDSLPTSIEVLKTWFESASNTSFFLLNSQGKVILCNERSRQTFQVERKSERALYEQIVCLDENDRVFEKNVNPIYAAVVLHKRQLMPFFCNIETKSGKQYMVLKSYLILDQKKKVGFIVLEIRSAERMLKLDEMKSTFVSFAAHQLKTPSSIIKGFLELLINDAKELLPAEQNNFLLSAYEANEQLIERSRGLLNLTKIQGGMIEPNVSEVNVGSVLRKKISNFKNWIDSKSLHVELVVKGLVVGNTDQAVLGEIFDIVMHNAVKYSPKSGLVKILCTIDNAVIKILVIDQGKDDLSTDFLNEQKELNQAFNVQSHGLGLHLAKQYASILRGSVNLFRKNGETNAEILLANF